jgi:hypothetical protein
MSNYLDEKLTAGDPVGKWIHDFVHSDNPKFAGKSKKERIKQALGAAYSAKKEMQKEDYDSGEYDYEGDMAKSDLRSIIYNAKMLHDMLEANTNLPEWLQAKITKAEDYISSAANYMRSEQDKEK